VMERCVQTQETSNFFQGSVKISWQQWQMSK